MARPTEDQLTGAPRCPGHPGLCPEPGEFREQYAHVVRARGRQRLGRPRWPGATYTPFPDARSHRITLADMRAGAVRERLRLLWTDPMALDPSRASAKVTRLVSDQLAKLARSLEEAGHRPESVAAFLTRCLFSMFAEDVGLLPKDAQGQGAFASLLRKWCDQPDTLRQMLAVLWTDMDRGGFSPALAATVLRFNGKLFKGSGAADYVLPLTRNQIDAHCKARQAEHPGLTLTGIYNAIQARRLGVAADQRDQEADTKGLAGVLLRLHDELDAAVLSAYGWEDLAPSLAAWAAEDRERREAAVGKLLQRLADLNSRRAAEEAAGMVRWLRPEFQNPAAAPAAVQAELAVEPEDDEAPAVAAAPVVKRAWPSGLPEQIKAVSDVLASAGRPLGLEDLAAYFAGRGRWRDRLPTIVETLEAIGRARAHAGESTWVAA